MFDCRYCGRYTRLRPCCSSVECTRRNEEYDLYADQEARERASRRKGFPHTTDDDTSRRAVPPSTTPSEYP